MVGWEGTKKAHKNEEGNQNMFLQMGKYECARMLLAAEKSRKRIENWLQQNTYQWTPGSFSQDREVDLPVPEWENVCDIFVDLRKNLLKVAKQ